MVDSYLGEKTDFFSQLFAKVEEFIVSGHSKHKENASLGFLETLQTYASNQDCGYKPFEKWLGQSSLSEWYRLEAVWSGKPSLMDAVRAEKKQE